MAYKSCLEDLKPLKQIMVEVLNLVMAENDCSAAGLRKQTKEFGGE
jgi:hypothetical protein